MDTMTAEQRSRVMAAIHSKDTKPELLVRRYLFARGYRYRLNHPRLPGHPDIVMRKYRAVVFVNGCFWHGHNCPTFRLPKTNSHFWREKIERNRRRDKAEQQRLAAMGWHCITVWECELKPQVREQTLRSLERTLNHLYIKDRSPGYAPIEEERLVAAEPEPQWPAKREPKGEKNEES